MPIYIQEQLKKKKIIYFFYLGVHSLELEGTFSQKHGRFSLHLRTCLPLVSNAAMAHGMTFLLLFQVLFVCLFCCFCIL